MKSQNSNPSMQDVEALAAALKSLQQDEGDKNINITKQPTQKGIHISPVPGFSFKTCKIADGKKVFINITQHEIIDKPALKKKLDADGNEVEGMNIPMSVGIGRSEVDKKGVECEVYDIVVNPDVVHDVVEDATGKFREFLCQLGIQCIEQKYKMELDKRYKLPKLKYMGDSDAIPQQYIQDRKNMPKIEEVSRNKQANSQSSSTSSSNKANDAKKVSLSPSIPEVEKEVMLQLQWVGFPGDMNELSDQERLQSLIRDCVQPAEQSRSCEWSTYTHAPTEYLDPIMNPLSENIKYIVATFDFQSYELLGQLKSTIKVSFSPYKYMLKIPGYKLYQGYLCCAINPLSSHYFLRSVDGYVSLKKLFLVLQIDFSNWSEQIDAGSKPWLLSQAISEDLQTNPYASDGDNFRKTIGTEGNESATNEFPEDKFHIKLPNNVDQYTGVKMDENSSNIDDWELPEDRFHKKDAGSSFLLSQREQAKKDKWEKHEKERQERKNDPNVEYVDMDDFRPGGKYGSKSPASNGELSTNDIFGGSNNKELAKASAVLSEVTQGSKASALVSSNLWTELLD